MDQINFIKSADDENGEESKKILLGQIKIMYNIDSNNVLHTMQRNKSK